jgi:hypothetical protein
MDTNIILYILAGIFVGVISKIVFDWFKGNRNNKQFKILEDMLKEIKEIKTDVAWTRDVHDNDDPITGQPRWFFPSDMKGLLEANHKILKKIHNLLYRLWVKTTGGTDPGDNGD